MFGGWVMGESSISAMKWGEMGEPPGVWFTIVRHERLVSVNDTTHERLASRILRYLRHCGEFKTRQYDARLGNFMSFEYEGHDFLCTPSTGSVNGEYVPVLAVGIDAMILETK
jgi:hypothetical protein